MIVDVSSIKSTAGPFEDTFSMLCFPCEFPFKSFRELLVCQLMGQFYAWNSK